MLRAVIIDDEQKSCNTLSTLIARYTEGVEVCGMALNVAEGIRLIHEAIPQLVFLDVSMPDGTGFDLLDRIEHKNFELIFTTAYHEYAVRAIRMQAADYLLKPIDIAELQNAVTLVRNKLHALQSSGIVPLQQAEQKYKDKIAISVNGGLEFLPYSEIIHLAAKGSYTSIFCQGKTILSSHSLKEHEDLLPPGHFFRTHHSHIVNLLHIKHFHRGDGGYIVMTDNTEIALSRRKRKDFLSLFLA